jgi:hypothetical protein
MWQDSKPHAQDAPQQSTEFYVIHISPAAELLEEFHTREEFTAKQHENFRSLIYDDFPELLQPLDSPHVSRPWDHLINTIGMMKRQRLNTLSHAECEELNRQLKDAMEVGLI